MMWLLFCFDARFIFYLVIFTMYVELRFELFQILIFLLCPEGGLHDLLLICNCFLLNFLFYLLHCVTSTSLSADTRD